MRTKEPSVRRRLREWDPAADERAPSRELYGRIRTARAAANEPRWRRRVAGWLAGRWSVVAVGTAGAVLVGLTLMRLDRSPAGTGLAAGVDAAAPESPGVQLVYTASNGVRVYWSVLATEPSQL